ncbi:MAG: hypothetical protein IT349_00415 [Candidatus Eisenbacteria bacterium]|nr:hypothetical protein [Candidatus Eisenbacteria bacterium]
MLFRRPASRFALLAALFLFPSADAGGATRRVPADHSTIQAAIDAAAAADTVLVAAGTYSGEGNRDLNFNGRDLVLISESGAAATIIDVQGNAEAPHRGMTFKTAESRAAIVEGFTILNGFMSIAPSRPRRGFADDAHDLSAGGILIQNSSPTIRDVWVFQCQSDYSGGGIEIELGAKPLLERVVIKGCVSSQLGGGLSVERQAQPTLIDLVVTGNFAPDGAGVAVSAIPTFNGLLVAGNTAGVRGGGIFCTGFARTTMENALVWNNCAPEGGEIFTEAAQALSFTCSVIDSSDVARSLSGEVRFGEDCRFVDPIFCGPVGCDVAPTLDGDYRVGSASICLPGIAPCGALIGVLGQGTCSVNPTLRVTWGGVKARYGDPARRMAQPHRGRQGASAR